MRKLATIRTISALNPIEGADAIVCAQVDGWECVVKKDEFKVGDKCVYIEIDSIVPASNKVFEFLESRKYRVRTIKLKGQVSQGLCLPIDLFPNIMKKKVDTDVTDDLGIVKYDPQAQKERQESGKKDSFIVKFLMRYKWFRAIRRHLSDSTKGFPSHIVSKTDEERIQNMTSILRNNAGVLVSATEKLDGQSYTATLRKRKHRLPFTSKYEFVIASRNLRIGLSQKNTTYIDVTNKYGIYDILVRNIGNYDSIAIQGEICGPTIQGNKYKLDSNDLFIFRIKFNKDSEQTFMSQKSVVKFAEENKLKAVPFLGEFKLPETVQELVDLSSSETSRLTKDVIREGIVIREAKDNYGFSFKVINPKFLLKHDE